MGRHVWSDEVKAQALELLGDPALTLVDVHHRTSIPTSTLHDWSLAAGIGHSGTEQTKAANEARRVRIAAKRESLAEELLDIARDLYHGASEAVKPRDAQSLATAAAIVHDKHRLEMGEVTGRLENREVTFRIVDQDAPALGEKPRLVKDGTA